MPKFRKVKLASRQGKVAKVMKEYKQGALKSMSKKGPMVRKPKQALAVALQAAGKMKRGKK